MSEEKELTLPRYVLYDSEELKILCAAEHGEPIIDYLNALMRIKKESSIKTGLQIKRDELTKEIEPLREYVSLLKDAIAATKEAGEIGVDISAVTTNPTKGTHDKHQT